MKRPDSKRRLMRELLVRPTKLTELHLRPVTLEAVEHRIAEPVVVRDERDGQPLFVYLDLKTEPLTHLSAVATRIALANVTTWAERARTNRLKSRATTFGYQPRITLRRDYCAQTRLTREQPAESEQLFALARRCAHHYAEWNPTVFWNHVEEVEREVLPCWRIGGTPFTGGIVNETTNLAYHRDNGNYKRTWSAMVVLREHVAGGWLVVPELDLAIETADLSLTMFYGQDYWHGVSPLHRTRRNGRRYSIVFYSLKTMRNCLCPEDEFTRYRQVRTVRERNRRAGVRAGE